MKIKVPGTRAVGCTICLITALALHAQTPQDSNKSCNSFALQTVPALTVKQRGCFFVRQLIRPDLAARSVMFAAFDQYRNSPRIRHESWDKFPRRIEIYYARHAARYTGEFLVGALHHEEPRPQHSHSGGFWRRTNAAFLDVVTSPDSDGRLRPAFAPIAGSFSSAVAGTLMYRHSETLPNVLSRAGIAYGFYFARATFTEFKPDLIALAHKILN